MKISETTNLLIDQLILVISQMDDHEFSRPLELYNGSSIGMHFRHIYDFYGCLINHCQKGSIDYALRDREASIEKNPLIMINKLQQLKAGLSYMDEKEVVNVYSDFEFDDHSRAEVKSSVGRELLYAYDHAVHHLAIIKLGIKQTFPHIDIDKNMGVASSTIRYQEHQTHQH